MFVTEKAMTRIRHSMRVTARNFSCLIIFDLILALLISMRVVIQSVSIIISVLMLSLKNITLNDENECID